MRRRDFLAHTAVIVWTFSAAAQEARPMIGFLSGVSEQLFMPSVKAEFLRGLKDTGFVEDRNLSIEYRF
jgi:putative ABC transport system substrate-binding protein